MTARLLRALKSPYFKIWGHPLGRLIPSRPPFACRMEEVLDAIAEARCAIEVNGDPRRLDLEPRWIRAARARGIKFVISTDAHSIDNLDNLPYGVAMARRGWLTAAKYSTRSMPRNLPKPCTHEPDIFAFAGALRWLARPLPAQKKQPLRSGAETTQYGVPLGELFSYLSALYFRGKLAYAQRSRAAGRLSGDVDHHAHCRSGTTRFVDPLAKVARIRPGADPS